MSILRREVLYHQVNGNIRFLDWALTTTTLGAMAEPFCVSARHSVQTPNINFDANDIMARIDGIRQVDHGQDKLALSGGDHALNGGPLMPLTGP